MNPPGMNLMCHGTCKRAACQQHFARLHRVMAASRWCVLAPSPSPHFRSIGMPKGTMSSSPRRLWPRPHAAPLPLHSFSVAGEMVPPPSLPSFSVAGDMVLRVTPLAAVPKDGFIALVCAACFRRRGGDGINPAGDGAGPSILHSSGRNCDDIGISLCAACGAAAFCQRWVLTVPQMYVASTALWARSSPCLSSPAHLPLPRFPPYAPPCFSPLPLHPQTFSFTPPGVVHVSGWLPNTRRSVMHSAPS